MTDIPFDDVIEKIADYVVNHSKHSEEAYTTARLTLGDALGCAILSLRFSECTKLLGPVVPGTVVPYGSHVIGTSYVLDPIRATFNIGAMVRWLDFNDTWLAAEWGHPSDNICGLLAVMDYQSRVNQGVGLSGPTVRDLLTAMITAYEIQGTIALNNSFNRVGFDHVILVKVATAAVVTEILGGDKNDVAIALSNAWIDTGPLRTYRHAPNAGSRKSWAAGDAASRGVSLAYLAMQGEMGYPSALSAEKWGLYDVLFKGKPFVIPDTLGSYVMENILFKVAFPAEFHAQTAVECAIKLYPMVNSRFDDIASITIETHESALRIIDKKGPLHNPAARDHCLQYMTAIALLHGNLTAEHYEDVVAEDARIDHLRALMQVKESTKYSKDYLNPAKRSIANAVTIHFKDGTASSRVEVEYPLGHRRRREESLPLLYQKLEENLLTYYEPERVAKVVSLFRDDSMKVDEMPVSAFIDLFC